jgi:hypothetical protein
MWDSIQPREEQYYNKTKQLSAKETITLNTVSNGQLLICIYITGMSFYMFFGALVAVFVLILKKKGRLYISY